MTRRGAATGRADSRRTWSSMAGRAVALIATVLMVLAGVAQGDAFAAAGDAIEEVDTNGHHILDDTFLILLNAHYEPVPFVLPAHRAGVRWQPVVDTYTGDTRGRRPARGGRTYEVAPRSLAVLRLQEAP